MKIIILGGGQVGSTLAAQLVKESHEITVVDSDDACLKRLQEKLDLRCVVGQATYPDILQQAGAAEADSIVAVTASEEVNLLACQIAYTLFKTPKRIARISASAYLHHQETLFNPQAIPIDHLLNPGRLVANHIAQLVHYPGAHQLWIFAQGQLALLVLKATPDQPWINRSLSELDQQLAPCERRVVILGRQQRLLPVAPSTLIEVGDELWFVVASEQLHTLITAWEGSTTAQPTRRVVIVGGGNIGAALARQLVPHYNVKVIERNAQRATELSALLPEALVFCTHGSDQTLLLEEHIEQSDLFIAVTNDDEDNILSALLARHLGAKQTLVLIQQPIYHDLIQDQGIDRVITPQQITISAILTHLHCPAIKAVCSLQQGEVEVMEWQIEGEISTSQVIGRQVGEIMLPEGGRLIALARGKLVSIADDQQEIQAGDHLILLLFDKKSLGALEKQLQPTVIPQPAR
ncbi:Trk system potassium transporter TrkA [unidentified bacterial endosymbiont]|uniref:Trk system potassium transporter TrkA n=1 Tax=unidentified bacterial endosymbiont TaxID=2355 RepID=UPI00209E972A|nr:Trk system potassium transporter TrkA [unidentified bacterial endosymbiont]